MLFREEILQFLACPRCQGNLIYDRQSCSLLCPNCKLKFSIEDGIPILLLEEAEEVR